jgi:hypothetical protein
MRSKRFHHPWAAALALLVCSFLAACSTISNYDQAAYEHAVNAKVDTLALMNKATQSYSDHTKDVADLNLELDKAYEYDKGRPLNRFSVASWDVLRGSNGIISRFFNSWKTSGTLSPSFIADKQGHVAREFDDIIQLESGKNKSAPAP